MSAREYKDVNTLSFEESLEELEGIVNALENEKVALEDAIKHYQRGMELRSYCDKKLQDAKLKVEEIIHDGSKVEGNKPMPIEE